MMLIALEAGAEDLKLEDGSYVITTSVEELDGVRRNLEAAGVQVESASLVGVPTNVVTLGLNEARSILKLVDALDDHDDVQNVFGNFDIPDEVLEQLEQEN